MKDLQSQIREVLEELEAKYIVLDSDCKLKIIKIREYAERRHKLQSEAIEKVMELIESKIPEKRELVPARTNDMTNVAVYNYNQAISDIKAQLKGGGDGV